MDKTRVVRVDRVLQVPERRIQLSSLAIVDRQHHVCRTLRIGRLLEHHPHDTRTATLSVGAFHRLERLGRRAE